MSFSTLRLPLLTLLALASASSPAFADASIGSMADHVVGSGTFGSILDLFSGICYLVGLIFGIKSALQLRDHSYNPQQAKLSRPIVSMVVCSLLLSMPTLFSALQATFGATGSQLGGFASMAAGSPGQATDLSGMFQAFATNIPAIARLVSFGAICGGAFMILRAILMLPQVEQGREHGPKVIWLMIAGLGLWALLPFITASMTTMGMGSVDASNLLTSKYAQASGGDSFDATIASVMVFVQLLGLIAFIRGMVILKALGENKDGAMGRALTHIFGGAAAMNVAFTVKMLAYSIGASATICGISTNLCA